MQTEQDKGIDILQMHIEMCPKVKIKVLMSYAKKEVQLLWFCFWQHKKQLVSNKF